MKKKYYIIVLFLVLTIFISGCSGGIPTTPRTTSEDEANVKSVIYEYFVAISYQNWSKAKSSCVYVVDISNVSISGSFAQAYISLNIIYSFGGYYYTESGSAYYYLQKVGNDWKIYGP